ncbi:hypothetical protein [Mesorhizobium sp. M7A.F.Ca.US.011.01.1.1]|uniref:hypothetical protein n=1 Tax=Mesorhizobium sp. M7A.F.Ca.US.011.01.1.1 TaxID=2496741 RepID=UPI0032AE9DA5
MRYCQTLAFDAVSTHQQPSGQPPDDVQPGIDQPGVAGLQVKIMDLPEEKGRKVGLFAH